MDMNHLEETEKNLIIKVYASTMVTLPHPSPLMSLCTFQA